MAGNPLIFIILGENDGISEKNLADSSVDHLCYWSCGRDQDLGQNPKDCGNCGVPLLSELNIWIASVV